ncbi:MAG: putative lipid II flippase FtsW [Coprococcus sp.]
MGNSKAHNNAEITSDNQTTPGTIWIKGGYIDYPFVAMVLLIVCIGLIMVYSTSSYRGMELFNDSAYFAKRQLVFALVAMVFAYLVSRMDYRVIAKYSGIILIVSMILLILVYIIGTASHGSARWLYIGPFGFQPSECAKVSLIIYTAATCTANTKSLNTIRGVAKIMLLPVIAVILIAIENLSTAIICFAIVFIILFVASPKTWYFIVLAIIGIAGCALFIAFAGYRADRIRIWLAPEKYPDGYQTMQSLYAIGSGGIFGRGLGNSIQKMGFIPESHNDMIFSVICEELGIFGALCIIGLFIVFLKRCMVIAINAADRLGGLLVTGVMAHIAVQLIINISVVTNTIPPTGVPLPFISYGGSSIVFILIEMGLVMSVARRMKPGR